jgi:2-iminobutanoate/2-iminopropanoate deaminase
MTKFTATLFISLGVIGFGLSACQQQTTAPSHRPQEVITVEGMPALGPYSPAIKAGGMAYISGVIAYDYEARAFAPPSIEAQTRLAFENLKAVLAASGCELNDVVKITVFLKNPSDMGGMSETYAEYFPDYKPARTTVPGVDWGRDNILIEIDAIALVPQ